MSRRAFLGLGSNLGDRLATLESAVAMLREQPGLRVVGCSRVWETDPVGPVQPDFLNLVLEIDTTLDPFDLLRSAQQVETALHRERVLRWGPRTIDIDLLFVDDIEMVEPDLTIPHPQLLARAFAVLPLMELAPDLVVGGVALRDANVEGGARPYAPPFPVAGVG